MICFRGQEIENEESFSYLAEETYDKLFAGLVWVVYTGWPKMFLITDLLSLMSSLR